MPREITGFSNPLVKRVRSLRDKKQRRLEGRFLAEGTRILAEAAEIGALPELLIYVERPDMPAVARDVITRTAAAGGDVVVTSADILGKMSGKDNPGTLIGIYPERWTPLETVDRTSAPLWIVAERLRDPGNLGTMLRTGDAVGAGGLILVDDCVDPFSVEAVRASMGALFTQTIARAGWEDFLAWLRAGPGELIGTSLRTETDYQAPRYTTPAFILVGNEAQGLSQEKEAACDHLVRIPMAGRADSLNAAVATAVMAYEVVNQLRRRS